MVFCYFWYVTVTNLCHSNKFSLSNQQITFYSVMPVQVHILMHWTLYTTVALKCILDLSWIWIRFCHGLDLVMDVILTWITFLLSLQFLPRIAFCHGLHFAMDWVCGSV